MACRGSQYGYEALVNIRFGENGTEGEQNRCDQIRRHRLAHKSWTGWGNFGEIYSNLGDDVREKITDFSPL